MKKLHILLILFLGGSFSTWCAPNDMSRQGSLQVTCPPGFEVSIDGVFVGKSTSDLGGLIVSPVEAGTHEVTIASSGFETVERTVTIQASQTAEIVITPKKTQYKVTNSSEENVDVQTSTGSLIIQSLPLHATVLVNGKKIGTTDLRIDQYPAGSVKIKIQRNADVLTTTTSLQANDELMVKADFRSKTIAVSSRIEQTRKEQKALQEQERIAAEQSIRQGIANNDALEKIALSNFSELFNTVEPVYQKKVCTYTRVLTDKTGKRYNFLLEGIASGFSFAGTGHVASKTNGLEAHEMLEANYSVDWSFYLDGKIAKTIHETVRYDIVNVTDANGKLIRVTTNEAPQATEFDESFEMYPVSIEAKCIIFGLQPRTAYSGISIQLQTLPQAKLLQ